MKKLKVMTIVGTRPEIIRLSRVIAKFDHYCDHLLIHTGQNYDYELNDIFFKDLLIRSPNVFLNAAGKNAAETIGNIIILVDSEIEKFNPEAILLLGDTNSCLSAIAAKRRKVPIFHMEAGNRCFDLRVPEEINRRIVDHIADVNLPYSDISRQYLLREGLSPDYIIKTGSPMYEILDFYKNNINESKILNKLGLQNFNYFLISTHREENLESNEKLYKLFELINTLASEFEIPVIVSAHPRMRKQLDKLNYNFHPLVHIYKPFGFFDYVYLQINSRVVLSDSGTITEESSILNFPALNLREVQERPEGIEEGSVMFVGFDINLILQSLKVLFDQGRGSIRTTNLVKDYEVINYADKILRIVFSFTGYINRNTWKKY
jgi:UDP-N-acetylglucosamine 2-epimerase (non-hydrolysing)